MMKNNSVAMITWKKITSLRDIMFNSIDYDIKKVLNDNYVDRLEVFFALDDMEDTLDSIIYRWWLKS